MFEGDDYYHKWGVLCWPTVQGFIHHDAILEFHDTASCKYLGKCQSDRAPAIVKRALPLAASQKRCETLGHSVFNT